MQFSSHFYTARPDVTPCASQFANWVLVAASGEFSFCHIPVPQAFKLLIPFLVLYFYDFLLTFSDEVSEIWPSKWSLTKAAWLLSRYGGMGIFVLDIVTAFAVTDSDRVSRAPFIYLFAPLY